MFDFIAFLLAPRPGYNPLMRRTDLLDTKEWAHRRMVLRARAMTPSERAHLISRLTVMGREIQRLAEGRQAAAKQQAHEP